VRPSWHQALTLAVAVVSSSPAQLFARMKVEAKLWGPIIKAAKGE